MATFTAIRNKKQSASAMRGVLDYVEQEKKTRWGGARLVTGHNCVPQSALTEMRMTKQRFRKTGGTQFYHFVQSFSADDDVMPQEVNAIGLEFAQRQFPDFEVVVATHVDTGHLHNHFVVNSVSCADGHKLHQSPKAVTPKGVQDAIDTALQGQSNSGEWTPTLDGVSSYTTRQGWYTKNGKVVTIGFYISAKTKSNLGNTTLAITGVPFSANYTAAGGGYLSSYKSSAMKMCGYLSTSAFYQQNIEEKVFSGWKISGTTIYAYGGNLPSPAQTILYVPDNTSIEMSGTICFMAYS